MPRSSSRRPTTELASARTGSIPGFLEILTKCQNFEVSKSQAAPQRPRVGYQEIPNVIPLQTRFAPSIFLSPDFADGPTYEKLIFENHLEILTFRNFDILSKFREVHQQESKWEWGRLG